MVSEKKGATHVAPTTLGAPKTVRTVKGMVVETLNKFLKTVHSGAPGFFLHVDFYKGNFQHPNSRLFNGHGIEVY